MRYTVHELAEIAHISVRTLHYYDEIGLLTPSSVGSNGYRYYEEKELLRLQQIMFFKELAFSLEDIQGILAAPHFRTIDALQDQRKLLLLQQERLSKLITTIDMTIKKIQGGETMTNDDLFASFTKDQVEAYKEEAKKRWGHTDAYRQSVEQTKHWTQKDYQKAEEQMKEITLAFAGVMGQKVESHAVQDVVERHYQYIAQFYEFPYEMYRNLGQMYVDDARFTAHYDGVKKGLAKFVRDAISYYVEVHEGKSV